MARTVNTGTVITAIEARERQHLSIHEGMSCLLHQHASSWTYLEQHAPTRTTAETIKGHYATRTTGSLQRLWNSLPTL